MMNMLIEIAGEILTVLLVTLIGVLGTWLTVKIGKKQELAAIAAAQEEVIKLAQLTVEELAQTTVEQLKAGREDGKLTKDEIAMLGDMLLDGVYTKMSIPTAKLLNAAAVDVTALIRSAGESWVTAIKAE